MAALPDDVRIDLIARRADITASRWRVEAAESSRESARAEFFPDVSINALIGVQSIHMSTLIEYGSRVPNGVAAVHLPLFDAGRLKARYGATQAALDQAVAVYQDTVVNAARDVATQASTLAQLSAQRTQREIELDAALNLKIERRSARAPGPHRFANRIERHRCVDRAARCAVGARCGRRLGGHRAEARARRRL